MNTDETNTPVFYNYLPDDPKMRAVWEKRLVSVSLTLEDWAQVHAVLMTTFTSPDFVNDFCGPTNEIERCANEKFPEIAKSLFFDCRTRLWGTRGLRLKEMLTYLYKADFCLFEDLRQLANEVSEEDPSFD
jgi:hypothetical protein